MQNGHLIQAGTLKISAFLKNLMLGRGFGSVFRHQYSKFQSLSGWGIFWFFPIETTTYARSLASVGHRNPQCFA